jgi:hypothetical protein
MLKNQTYSKSKYKEKKTKKKIRKLLKQKPSNIMTPVTGIFTKLTQTEIFTLDPHKTTKTFLFQKES